MFIYGNKIAYVLYYDNITIIGCITAHQNGSIKNGTYVLVVCGCYINTEVELVRIEDFGQQTSHGRIEM